MARRLQPAVWLIVLFWAGCVAPLVLFLMYLVSWIAPDPTLARTWGVAIEDFQVTSAVLSIYFVVLLLLQLAAAWGLTTGRRWGKIVGTVVCALWVPTLLGIPVSVAALAAIWARWAPLPGPVSST